MNNEFIVCLQQQHEVAGDFVTLLEEEQALLATTPVAVNALLTTIERKGEYAAQLEALEHERRDILIANGYSPDRAGAERYASQLGCDTLWRSFLERVSQAQAQNRINGFHVQTRLDFHQRTLNFLQSAAGMSLYGPNGQTRGLFGKSISSRV